MKRSMSRRRFVTDAVVLAAGVGTVVSGQPAAAPPRDGAMAPVTQAVITDFGARETDAR